MLVDNPLQQQHFAPYSSALDEFLNLELFAGPSNPSPGSSGSSPHSSPSNSFTGLPPTPPDFFSRQDDPFSLSPFFSIAAVFEEVRAKFATAPPSATTAAGYDFLDAYAQSTQMSSPDSTGSGSGSRSSGDSGASTLNSCSALSLPRAQVTSTRRWRGKEREQTSQHPLNDILGPRRLAADTQGVQEDVFQGETSATHKISARNFRVRRKGAFTLLSLLFVLSVLPSFLPQNFAAR